VAKSSSPSITSLREQLEALARFEPVDTPVLSLYLNLSPDQHGRDSYQQFLKRTFAERVRALRGDSRARDSFERDAERIRTFLATEVDPATNALAVFASAGASGFFQAVQLDARIDEHWLFIASVPHLYPLARLVDHYPRYAAVVLDTSSARIVVFGLSTVERAHEITSDKTRRSTVGGWSQARYQRHADDMHLRHVKEVVEALDRIVTSERISQIVVAGDEVAVPILRDQLPRHLSEKLVDIVRLERSASIAEILEATTSVIAAQDAVTDRDHVERLITEWRSGGLGVAGPEATLRALEMGQVDELIVTARPATLRRVQRGEESAPPVQVHTTAAAVDAERLALADTLVAQAERTGARIRFVEDPALLADLGGVGALLRFRL
jgi:peptide chain release factor subunit 1